MLVVDEWTVAGHRANKCWPLVAEGDPSDTTLLCISCALVGGSGRSSSVFMGLTIPSAKLSPTILAMQHSVGDWKMLFPSVRNQPDITTDEVDELAEQSSASVLVQMRTEFDVFLATTRLRQHGTPRPLAIYVSRLQRSCHPLSLSPSPYRRRFSSPSFSTTKKNYKIAVTQRRDIPFLLPPSVARHTS
jgi:hypothetical protein